MIPRGARAPSGVVLAACGLSLGDDEANLERATRRSLEVAARSVGDRAPLGIGRRERGDGGAYDALGGEVVNSIVREHLAATYFLEYQGLRDQLLKILTDADLGFRVGNATASLGALCREIGEIEHSYVESFRTFRQDFGYRNPDPQLESSVAALSAGTGTRPRADWRPSRTFPRMTPPIAGSSATTSTSTTSRPCHRSSWTSTGRLCSSSTARPASTYEPWEGRCRRNGRSGSARRSAQSKGPPSGGRPP